jgi:hypothetical protein
MRAKEIFEEYVKPLSKTERLRLLALLAEDVARQSPDQETHQHSIMELHGLGKEIWEGIDTQEYVNELRKEWEHRP